jgi:hypothetical protein
MLHLVDSVQGMTDDRLCCALGQLRDAIAKHTKVDMIWVAGRSPTLVSYSLRGVAMNLKATTLTYLAIFHRRSIGVAVP